MGILRAEWWGWRCGRRRRRAAAAAGWVPAGTSLRRRARGLAWAGGALPTRALSAGGGRQGTVRGGGARRGGGEPPASPRRGASGGRGGIVPRARPPTPRLAPRVGRGSRPGSAFLPAPAPSSHKRQESTGLGQRSCPPGEEPGEGKMNSGRGDYNKRDSIPERPLPRENFLFSGCRDRGKTGWEFLCKVPARFEGCPAGPANPVRCLRAHHRRRGGGSAAQPPPHDPLGAASRAPLQRGGCSAAPAPAHGSRSPATLSPAPRLSFAFPAPLAFEPPPVPGVLSACQLIPFSPEGFVPLRAPTRRFPARRGAP